jgi:myo-inositol 2-dehydrogenase / D-chiro-inositol 1-dehydrogenase
MNELRRNFLFGSLAAAVLSRPASAEPVYGTGIIGVGNRGTSLLKTIVADPNARVTAVCDIKPDRLDRAASIASRDNPKTYSDYRKLLEDKSVEAVFISTPCDLHVEMAIAALRAGKHIYCEKPLGITAESIRDVLRAAKGTKTVFMVGHQRRSDTQLRQVIAKIHEGIAGKVIMMKAQRHSSGDFAHDGQSADWLFDASRSGDVIVENAVHNLDVCNWVARNRPDQAAGFGGTLLYVNDPPGRTITDGYTLSYDYANGVKLSFTQVAFHPSSLPSGGQQIYIYCTEGAVDVESATFYPHGRQSKPVVLAEEINENREGNHIGMFYDCIRRGTKPETDITQGAVAALTSIMGREAYKQKRVVTWKELGVEI